VGSEYIFPLPVGYSLREKIVPFANDLIEGRKITNKLV
jgi:hypothetical protein